MSSNSSTMNLMSLNDSLLKMILKRLPLKDMCNVAQICKRLENLCIDIWITNDTYISLIEFKDNYANGIPEYFLRKMAPILQSMIVHTSDFGKFNDISENVEFGLLTELNIFNNSEKSKWEPAVFLKTCSALHTLTVCESLVRPYMDDILELPALKVLKICHDGEDEDFDTLMAMLIENKGIFMKNLSTPIDVFPPVWLSDAFMRHLNNLDFLTIDTRQCHYILNENDYHSLPFLSTLKMLKIIGTCFCEKHLMRLVLNCAELESFYYDPTTVDEWFRYKMNREQRPDGIFSNLAVYNPSDIPESFEIEENMSILEFH